jgi:hypothetical protein
MLGVRVFFLHQPAFLEQYSYRYRVGTLREAVIARPAATAATSESGLESSIC